MKDGKEVLSDLLKTAQLGQTEIRSVLDTHLHSELRAVLELQLREYDRIESEVCAAAGQRGWELRELEPAIRFYTDRRLRMLVNRRNCESRIADRMIRTSTDGLIRGIRHLHQYPRYNDRISFLSQKVMDCATANIRQLQAFL